jgi:hypothetical protein
MINGMVWASMSDAELKTECEDKGLESSSWMAPQGTVALLMQMAPARASHQHNLKPGQIDFRRSGAKF